MPFGRERNNWCETVSWAWLAHNLRTEGEKVFQAIQRSNYYVPPKQTYLTSIQNVHLMSCFQSSIFNGQWLVSFLLITNLFGIKNDIIRAETIAILVGLWHFVTEKNPDAPFWKQEVKLVHKFTTNHIQKTNQIQM